MNRLKELRLQNGYKTQGDLAKVLFVNQTAVSQWERGATLPSSQMLLKLSELYGESVDYLLGRTEERSPRSLTWSMNRLKELRKDRKETQEDIANMLGVDRTTYSKYESGASEPSFEILLKLSQIFNVSTDYLLGRTEQKNVVPSSFGQQLKALREEKDISQKELAEKLFVSAQAVSKWEKDKSSPNPETLAKIADILDVSADYLLERTEQQETPIPADGSGRTPEFVQLYERLNEAEQVMIMKQIRGLLSQE